MKAILIPADITNNNNEKFVPVPSDKRSNYEMNAVLIPTDKVIVIMRKLFRYLPLKLKTVM